MKIIKSLCFFAIIFLLVSCEQSPEMYTVTLDYDYLGTVETVRVAAGERLAEPPEKSKSNADSAGWWVEESGSERQWNFETDTVTADLTLKHRWKPAVSCVQLEMNDGTDTVQEIYFTAGEFYTMPTPEREGYVFEGWYRGAVKIADGGIWSGDRKIFCQAAWSPYGYETTVFIGEYEQDNDVENGAEPIEWLILDRSEDQSRYLLVSRYVIEYLPYTADKPVIYRSYKDRTLRTWLNEDFYRTAFADGERAGIRRVHLEDVRADDYIFLLSYVEIGRTLAAEYAIGIATAYVQAQGFTTEDMYGGALSYPYWVRHGDKEQLYMTTIGYGGGTKVGSNVGSRCQGVRPAMWVDAEYVDALLGE
ncbi:MAG: InlB B-repeat-containing protein [Clostridia bacterium]|nr:InlB B-repeat-containing protein [Clostridia bacterium]